MLTDNLRIKSTDTHFLKAGMTFMLHGILADWDAESLSRWVTQCSSPTPVSTG